MSIWNKFLALGFVVGSSCLGGYLSHQAASPSIRKALLNTGAGNEFSTIGFALLLVFFAEVVTTAAGFFLTATVTSVVSILLL